MLKVMTILRTMFLVFIVVVTIRAWPFLTGLPQTSADGYDRCALGLGRLQHAILYAIGWITLEVIVGWLVSVRQSRVRLAAKAAAAAQPPAKT